MNSPKKKTPTKPKSKAGRKRVTTDPVVAELIASFQNGLNITQACLQSGISRDAYHDRYSKDQVFADKMDRAIAYPSMSSRQVMLKAIKKGNAKAAAWWLAHKDRDEFSTKQEVKHKVDEVDQEDQERLADIILKNENNKRTDTTEGQSEPKAD